jgi:diguanylate cyclase (GGDEF)-like protein
MVSEDFHGEFSQENVAASACLPADLGQPLLDPVTGTWNSSGLERLFKREMGLASRQTCPLAVMLLVADRDDRDDRVPADGAVSDDIARGVVGRLGDLLRSTDLIVRYSEDAFVLLLPGVYPVKIPSLAEKVLNVFRTFSVSPPDGGPIAVNLSMGLACILPHGATKVRFESLIGALEKALKRARDAGGHRYEIASLSDTKSARHRGKT